MNNKQIKTFGDVKEGDFVYHVTTLNNYRTSIIKKKVQYTKQFKDTHRNIVLITIVCEMTSEWSWLDSYRDIPVNKTSVKNENTEPKVTYLCTTLEEAKVRCKQLVEDIIQKKEYEINRMKHSLEEWIECKKLMETNTYNIK
jgi:hypothetical protein